VVVIVGSHLVAEVEANINRVFLLGQSGPIHVLVHAETPVLVKGVIHAQVHRVGLGEGSAPVGLGLVIELDINAEVEPNGFAHDSFLGLLFSHLRAEEELTTGGHLLTLFVGASNREGGGAIVAFLVFPVSTDPAEHVLGAFVSALHLGKLHALSEVVLTLKTEVPLVTDNVDTLGSRLVNGAIRVTAESKLGSSEETSIILLVGVELASEYTVELVLSVLVVPHGVDIKALTVFFVDVTLNFFLVLLLIEVEFVIKSRPKDIGPVDHGHVLQESIVDSVEVLNAVVSRLSLEVEVLGA